MSLRPQRTQYIFDTSGYKYISMGDIMKMRQDWETFENVENYNDIIYQKLQLGNRNDLYYQFKGNDELNSYKKGQQLHIKRYPDVSFVSISERTMPNVTFTSPAPYITQPIRQNAEFAVAIRSSELILQNNDLAIYSHVSTYNKDHVHQYIFPSNEEKMAYDRADRRINSQS
jgi:hypothetical protein